MRDKWMRGWRWWLRYRLTGNPLGALKDIYWWIAHRTWRRFDRVKLRFLKPAYYDPDTRMIHAMFTILSDFIEREAERVNWDATEEHRHVKKEMEELYLWWKNSYLKRREPILDVPDEDMPDNMLESLGKSQVMYPVWHKACEATWKLEREWHEEDIVNMTRLVKIYSYLWV